MHAGTVTAMIVLRNLHTCTGAITITMRNPRHDSGYSHPDPNLGNIPPWLCAGIYLRDGLEVKTIVVTVEGVLRKVTDGQPIFEGIQLLQDTAPKSLILLTGNPARETEEWLDQHGIAYDLVLGMTEDRVHQLRRIQFEWGYSIDMVIEPDPSVCAELVREGYLTLGWFHPYFAKNEWRPDFEHEIRPWSTLAGEVADTARQRAAEEVKLRGESL